MCRIAIYRGPSIPLYKVIYDSPHNFIKQAQKPKEMVAAPLNGDGFGLAWYNLSVSSEPALITSEKPLWHDINLPRISDKIFSSNIFMHVRAASPGLPVHQANAHPFQFKEHLFMHNGIVSDFRKGFMRSIREMIEDPFYENIQGTTDSEHIFALYLTIRQQNPKLDVVGAVEETFRRVNEIAFNFNTDLVLNMAFSDGKTTIVTKYTNIEKCASLYYTTSSEHFPNGIIVASEKFDSEDHSWKEFPMNQMLIIDADNRFSFKEIANPFLKDGVLNRQAKPSTLLA